MLTLCLDIGGTKIAAGLADPAGTLVHTAQRPTPAYGGAEQVWAAVAEMIADALGVAGGAVGGVGIASAGPIDLHSGRVSPINIGSWGGFPLRDRVAAAVPGVPVRLGGDGVCMALGEHWLGAGRGARFLLGLVVSTGVGGGLVLDGAPCLGRTGNAGHVGHVVVDPDGSPCPCGGRGCVETIASGPSLARWARANGWSAPPGAGAKELAEAAGAGEVQAALAGPAAPADCCMATAVPAATGAVPLRPVGPAATPCCSATAGTAEVGLPAEPPATPGRYLVTAAMLGPDRG
ncbi:ROK family protein [Mycobacterium tuberculosis]|uniref:ROK family protein n=1 Tax=Mycobacterium tuberculosis TaxID=1773 RepID=UPI0035102E86